MRWPDCCCWGAVPRSGARGRQGEPRPVMYRHRTLLLIGEERRDAVDEDAFLGVDGRVRRGIAPHRPGQVVHRVLVAGEEAKELPAAGYLVALGLQVGRQLDRLAVGRQIATDFPQAVAAS